MSRKANPTLVGAFVLGAMVIAVGAVLFFGTTKLFTRTKTCVTYFQQSVAGLQVGSAVKFKGVPIGQVSKIQIRYGANEPTYIKIVFDINADLLVNRLGADIDVFNEKFNSEQIEKGLRTSLSYESFITGLLYLAIDYHENAGAPVLLQEHWEYSEIPSLPSNLEAILENAQKAIGNLGKIDFEALGKDLQALLETLKTGLAQVQFDKLNESIKGAADSIANLASSPELKKVLTDLSATLVDVQRQIDPLGAELTPAVADLRKTLQGLQKTVGNLNSTLAPEGDLRYQLNGTLQQLGGMAGSLRELSEFLQRNPNSLLFGRKPSKP